MNALCQLNIENSFCGIFGIHINFLFKFESKNISKTNYNNTFVTAENDPQGTKVIKLAYDKIYYIYPNLYMSLKTSPIRFL